MAFTMEFWVRHVRCLFDVHEMFGDFCIFLCIFCDQKTTWKVQQISRRGHQSQNGKACIQIIDEFGGKTAENWVKLRPLWRNISTSEQWNWELWNAKLRFFQIVINNDDYYNLFKLYYLQTTWLESSNWTERPCGNLLMHFYVINDKAWYHLKLTWLVRPSVGCSVSLWQ